MISRKEATEIAAKAILARGLGTGAHEAQLLDEISRAPSIFGGPDLRQCWLVYVERTFSGRIESSRVVLVSMEDGEILYSGSANDEG